MAAGIGFAVVARPGSLAKLSADLGRGFWLIVRRGPTWQWQLDSLIAESGGLRRFLESAV